MACANKKNALLERWAGTLTRHHAETALWAPTGQPLASFADVENEAETWLASLARFQPGSVLAIQIGNSPSWPALLLAAFRRKLIPLPLGRHIEKCEREAALTTCGAGGLVQANEPSFQFAQLDAQKPVWTGVPPDFLKLTSGTTSAPRAVRFRAEQLVADCDHICETMGIHGDDLNFGVIPFSHSYGFSNLLTPLLCRGVPLVASEDRMPRAILHGLAQSGATVFPGMPVFFEKFGEMENVPALPRLRLCISAGAPLTKRIAARFVKKFGRKIHTFYGSSECGGIGYDASDVLDYEDGFAGQPMKNVRITPLASATVTRLEVRSAAVGDGYFPTPDPETLGGGRFLPGDLVHLSPQGIFLKGRASDLINVAGRKLNPAEVEVQLAEMTGVKQVVVFGVSSALRHEEAIACVAGKLQAKEVLHFARTVLSGWQVPKAVWIVEEIPVNERGKISRRELSRRYLEKETHLNFGSAQPAAPLPGDSRELPPAR